MESPLSFSVIIGPLYNPWSSSLLTLGRVKRGICTSTLMALNAVILTAGIVLAIVGVVIGGIIYTIVGDVLVVGGVLLFFVFRRKGSPPPEPSG